MSIVHNSDGTVYDTADVMRDNWTLHAALEFVLSHLHICDVEAQTIANRISGAVGQPPSRPDGVQALEDAETLIRRALEYATA